MADELQKTGIQLLAEGAAKFISDVTDSNNALGNMATQGAASASDGLNVLGEIATGALRKIGELAIEGVMKLGDSLMDFMGDAMNAEKQLTQLQTLITSTGGAAGITLESAKALANQFRDMAGGSDEAVLSIEDMALRMGNISADQMPQFIQTTLDLAAATGTDATNAARMLAQAYDDPASAMGRFNKLGIRFTGDMDTQIKALVKGGDTAGAFALMMQRVSEATAGAAAGQAETLSGQIKIMQEHFLDAGKSIGEAMLPALKTLFETVIAPAIPIVEKLATQIGALASGALAAIVPFIEAAASGFGHLFDVIGSGGLGDYISEFGNIFLVLSDTLSGSGNPALQQASDLLGQIGMAVLPVTDEIANLQAAFMAALPVIQATLQNVIAWVVANWPKMQEAFNSVMLFIGGLVASVMANIKSVFDTIMPVIVANIQTTLAQMQIFWANHGNEIITILAGLLATVTWFINNVLVVVGATLALLSGVVASFWLMVNGNFTAAQTTMTASLDTFLNMIIGLTGTDLETVRASWESVFTDIYIITTTLWDQITTAIATAFKNITVSVLTWFVNFINTWRGNWEMIGTIISTVWTNIEITINATIGRIQSVISGFIGSISAAFETAKSIAGAIADLVHNLGGGAAPVGPGLAEGGPVSPGIAYPVGEKGPELFIPTSPGMILPNSMIAPPASYSSSAHSYSNVVNNTYNLNANYPMQSLGSVAQDVRMLQMLAA